MLKALLVTFLGVRTICRHLRDSKGMVSFWRWMADIEFHRRKEHLARVIALNSEIHQSEDGSDNDGGEAVGTDNYLGAQHDNTRVGRRRTNLNQ